jgi:hypothetical protein
MVCISVFVNSHFVENHSTWFCKTSIILSENPSLWSCKTPITLRWGVTVTSSRSNPETLAARKVLAHPHVVFHPCICGLCEGTVTISAALIGYYDVEVTVGTTTRRRRSWSTTFSTPTCDYIGPMLQLFFHCSVRLVVTIHDLLFIGFIGWHGRNSVNVVYLYPYSWVCVL